MTQSPYPNHPGADLAALARQAMLDEGFELDLPPDALQEIRQIEADPANSAGSGNGAAPGLRDLRSIPWSSIDNDDSQDLDQVEYVEALPDGGFKVMVGIADVDFLVRAGDAIDRHAAANSTSVYAGVCAFPMLPEELSAHLTSLLAAVDRAAVVVEMTVTPQGEVSRSKVYRAILRNHAKLTYHAVGSWLEGNGAVPQGVTGVTGMEEQIRLQNRAADALQGERARSGALNLETIEASPIMQGGRVVGLDVLHKNPARYIIENFMIAANTSMAAFLEGRGIPSIQRVVREPERWPRIVELAGRLGTTLPPDPDAKALSTFLDARRKADPLHFPDLSLAVVKLMGPGIYTVIKSKNDRSEHFGLAVHNYTHSTAPNRRYADLATQRIVKAALKERPQPYSPEALEDIASRCTERENAARKVERRMRKAAAAALFSDRIGQTFDAVVTGASQKGTFVRTISPPVEGMVVRGKEGMDVGDRVRVRLVSADPLKGFIDFERG